jgi:hypothetical protein
MSGAWPAFVIGAGAPATIRGLLSGVEERRPPYIRTATTHQGSGMYEQALLVTPQRSWEQTYPGTASQLRHVRSALREFLGDCPVADDAVCLLSELSANAVLHSDSGKTGGTFIVRAQHALNRYVRAVGGKAYRILWEPDGRGGLNWDTVTRLLQPEPRHQRPRQPRAVGRDLSGLARWVAAQRQGNRNAGLFWAANRALETTPAPTSASSPTPPARSACPMPRSPAPWTPPAAPPSRTRATSPNQVMTSEHQPRRRPRSGPS